MKKFGCVSCLKNSLLLLVAQISPVFADSASPPQPSSSQSNPKCECSAGLVREERDGSCYLRNCIAGGCDAVGTAYAVPGLWGLEEKIDCNTPGSTTTTTIRRPPPPKPPKPRPKPKPEPKPSESELLCASGNDFPECVDGDFESYSYPYIDYDGSCVEDLSECVEGCWFPDVFSQNPMPVDDSECEW